MKKIALIAPPWWLIPSDNIMTATEHLVEDFAYNFKNFKYSSCIYSRKYDKTDSSKIKDINCYDNKYKYTKVSFIDRIFFKKKNIFLYLIYIIKLSYKIKKEKIRKVIVFQTVPFCYWIKLFNPKAKILLHIGGTEFSSDEDVYNYGRVSKKMFKKVLPKIDVIITVSEYMKRDVEKLCGPNSKVYAIYPGIDSKLFCLKNKKSKKENINIVYLGRIVEEKGIYLLLKAFETIEKENPEINLTLIGPSIGPNIKEIKYNSKKINKIDQIPRKLVSEILQSTDIFIHPTLMEEPFGLAPLEAGLCENILITSNVKSGYSEILKDEITYFDSGNVDSLINAIRRVLNNYSYYKDKTKNVRHIIEKNTNWKKCIKETIDIFDNI